MSMQRPWFKMHPDQFFSATMGWPGDLKGFYLLLINLAEAGGGKIRDDLTRISRATGYQSRKCERLLNALQTIGKCSLNDGFWSLVRRSLDVCGSQVIENIECDPVDKNKNKNKKGNPPYPPNPGRTNGHAKRRDGFQEAVDYLRDLETGGGDKGGLPN